jgi:hypothetical protein
MMIIACICLLLSLSVLLASAASKFDPFAVFALSKGTPEPEVYYSDLFSDYCDDEQLSGLGDDISHPQLDERMAPTFNYNGNLKTGASLKLKINELQGFFSRTSKKSSFRRDKK